MEYEVSKNDDNCPSTLVKTLEKCDKDFFPNIHTLLRIACTLPVTSHECERACNTLKCVKTSLHSTMGQERLSALALMSIHRSIPIDFDNVVEFYVAIKEEFLRKTKEYITIKLHYSYLHHFYN